MVEHSKQRVRWAQGEWNGKLGQKQSLKNVLNNNRKGHAETWYKVRKWVTAPIESSTVMGWFRSPQIRILKV